MRYSSFKKENNFNLLRLLFALQVFVDHLDGYFTFPDSTFLNFFPGVPGFFFVSGFLIYGSYLNSTDDRNYFVNRFLRIYPALFFVVLICFFYLIYLKGTGHFITNFDIYFLWLLGQLTFLQVFTPEIFNDVGTGVINGSLWTISIELMFYLLIPFIVKLERYVKHIVLLTSIISFLIYFYAFNFLENYSSYQMMLLKFIWIIMIL